MTTSTWKADEWDDLALREFVDVAMRSCDPLPDLGSLLQRPAWQQRAACRGKGVDDFFPPDGSSRLRAAVVCGRCPVAEECMDYALSHPSLKGIWAGTSERGRHRMRNGSVEDGTGSLNGPDVSGARALGRHNASSAAKATARAAEQTGADTSKVELRPTASS